MSTDQLARAWVQQVERSPATDLADYVRRGVLSCGDAAGPLLLEFLAEPAHWDTRVAEHAIVLLGELRYAPALPAIADLAWDAPAYALEVGEALAAFGDDAIPPLVVHLQDGLVGVVDILVALARGKGRSDVREAIRGVLFERPEYVVPHLADLGDPELLPDMMQLLERLDETDPELRHEIVELVDAIEALGGDPGELGAHKSHTVRAARARWLAQMAAGGGKRRKKR